MLNIDTINSMEKKFYEKNIVWDSTQPMFIYKEEAVMSFTDYLCYCGGLLGLWFGTSAKDFIYFILNVQYKIKICKLFTYIIHLYTICNSRVFPQN